MSELFRTVLNMSISGGIVIAVIMLSRLPLRRAPKKWSYMLWIAAAFRLCCPVSVRSAISLFRVLPRQVSSGAGTAGETLGRLSYIPASANGMPSGTVLPPLAEVTSAPVSAAPAHVTSAPVSPAVTAAPLPAAPAVNPMNVLAALWLAGMAALIIYAAVDYCRTARRVAAATRLEGERNVFLSENVRSPFILGLLRPRILIPYGLSASELSCLLAHEKTHLKRGDHAIKAFAFVLLALHWFNPLCWLAFLLMSRDMELSCDEKVISGGGDGFAAEYSTTLLSFAVGKRFPAPSPLCFGETSVKERIKNAMRYKKPKLIVTVLALVLAAAVVAACVVNPSGTKPDDSAVPVEETPAPTAEPTALPTPAPTAKPAQGKGVSFTNSLGETVDKLYVYYAGYLFERMMYAPTDEWEDRALTAEGIAPGESETEMENDNFILEGRLYYDVGAYAGGRFYVLHEVGLDSGTTVELASDGGAASFTVTEKDGSETRYPAEIYEGDPFTVSARDENILQLKTEMRYCAVFPDSTRPEGWRAEWSAANFSILPNEAIAAAICRFVTLSEEDAARFPELAAAITESNESICEKLQEMMPLSELLEEYREKGESYSYYWHAEYNIASYVRRADTRVLSVLYQLWCGKHEGYHPEPADMKARRYESATFDTKTGRLLTPNDAAEGIDGGEKYPPHENYAWTYDHDGVSFFDNSLETPCCGQFVSIADNPSLFNESYLPFTENYIVTLSVIPGGDGLTVVHADGRDQLLRFDIDRKEGTENGADWSKITFTVEGDDMTYSLDTDWDDMHLDRILFVHANGRDYLYVLTDEPNGYNTTIFSIHNGRFFRVCRTDWIGQFYEYDTDPMALSGRCTVTVLGSSVGSYELAVNCYGVPMRTGWFSVNEEHTVLKALEVKLIDGDGAYTGETAVLEPGQKVIFLRTDGETLEDIMLPDGRIARIETDGYYSLSIGGEGVNRYFDNISIWE